MGGRRVGHSDASGHPPPAAVHSSGQLTVSKQPGRLTDQQHWIHRSIRFPAARVSEFRLTHEPLRSAVAVARLLHDVPSCLWAEGRDRADAEARENQSSRLGNLCRLGPGSFGTDQQIGVHGPASPSCASKQGGHGGHRVTRAPSLERCGSWPADCTEWSRGRGTRGARRNRAPGS